MVDGKMKYGWMGILFATLLISTYGIGGQGLDALSPNPDKARADMITIDTLKVFGYLEKPPVTFLHDAHTDALQKKGKDCSACHMVKEKSSIIPGLFKEAVEGIDALSPKFKRLEDKARKDVMDVYHQFCIECHTQVSGEGDKSGPVTCGGCHRPSEIESSRQPMGFDLSLHSRHAKAQEKKCEVCHHEYDDQAKKLFYAKGKEGSCRYCHRAVKEENRIPMREAAHADCISCHRQKIAKHETAGPVMCAGCHAPEFQANIKKLEEIPRMERNQPDAVLVKTGEEKNDPSGDKLTAVRMASVPFNHKAHETYNDTCRVCHHAAMDSCSKCHTMDGVKEGHFVKLEQAYHAVRSEKSCLGCHEDQKSDAKCAGCHIFMQKDRRQEDASCLKCHEKLAPEMEKLQATLEPKALAEMMIAARKYTTETYGDEDIPEKVVIKQMSDKYEPAEMPHRKIVRKLQENIKDNKIATFYHREAGTLCQGCHHNSPVSKKPPRCATCHGKPFNENEPARPGLMGAYHQQCMTCHSEMALEKPVGCVSCHKKKKS